MREILQRHFLDNTILTYIEVFGTIFLALFVKRIISKYLAILLFRWFSKAGKTFHKKLFLDLVVAPLDNFLFVLIIIIALDKLTLPHFLDFELYKVRSRSLLDGIAHTALIITFIRLCLRLVRYLSIVLEEKANLTADQTDNQLIVFFRDFFRVILYIVGILLLLRFTFNYDISRMVTGLSIVGAAIALATKESLENLIASFIIFFDKPFTTGDTVKVQGFLGTVEKIGLRSTRIRTDHKTFITVPNKQMVDTILDNITLRTQRRADLSLEIGLDTTAEQLRKIIAAIKNILQKEPIENSTVFLSSTGKNAHIITIEIFAGMQQTFPEFNELREAVNFEIIELLRSSGVTFAAASTDIVVTQKKIDD